MQAEIGRYLGLEVWQTFADSGLAEAVLRGLGFKNPKLKKRSVVSGEKETEHRRAIGPTSFAAAIERAKRRQGLD